MKTKSRQKESAGFTLIEILIVIGIVVIAAAVAMPAYNTYTNRATLKSVQAEVMALRLNFENFYQRRLAYPAANIDSTADLVAAFDSWSTDYDDKFDFNSVGNTQQYTINATGKDGGTENCIISFDNAGNKTITSKTDGGGNPISPSCEYTGDWL